MPTSWPSPTTPKTFTAAVVTVSDLNTELRDRITHVYEQKGNVRAVTTRTTGSPYTALVTDGWILVNSASAYTINLPACASLGAGWTFEITNINTGVVTIDANGSETINGSLTVMLPLQYMSVTVRTNGSNWFIT